MEKGAFIKENGKNYGRKEVESIKDIEIMCGDSLTILRNMEAESVDLILTDPPYGIDFNSTKSKARPFGRIANDKAPFIWWLYDAYRILKPNSGILCFTRWDVQQVFIEAMQLAGFTVKSSIVWDKKIHGMGDTKAQFAPRYELIIFAVKGKFSFPNGRPIDLFSVSRVPGHKLLHSNEKPVELMETLIEFTTRPGDFILDPFAGSGPTLVAASHTGRKCLGIELEASNCEIVRERLRREDAA